MAATTTTTAIITKSDTPNNNNSAKTVQDIQELYDIDPKLTLTLFKDRFNNKCKKTVRVAVGGLELTLPPVLLGTNERLKHKLLAMPPLPTLSTLQSTPRPLTTIVNTISIAPSSLPPPISLMLGMGNGINNL